MVNARGVRGSLLFWMPLRSGVFRLYQRLRVVDESGSDTPV